MCHSIWLHKVTFVSWVACAKLTLLHDGFIDGTGSSSMRSGHDEVYIWTTELSAADVCHSFQAPGHQYCNVFVWFKRCHVPWLDDDIRYARWYLFHLRCEINAEWQWIYLIAVLRDQHSVQEFNALVRMWRSDDRWQPQVGDIIFHLRHVNMSDM